jgi:hypothetical protein
LAKAAEGDKNIRMKPEKSAKLKGKNKVYVRRAKSLLRLDRTAFNSLPLIRLYNIFRSFVALRAPQDDGVPCAFRNDGLSAQSSMLEIT